MASDRILELLRAPVDPVEVAEIRELWKVHSIAEDNRDLPGLISTLTEDCVYTVAGTGVRWEGHEGAARFYTELLTAFPDIHFDLDYIVIGPQGVCEAANVSATQQAPSPWPAVSVKRSNQQESASKASSEKRTSTLLTPLIIWRTSWEQQCQSKT